MRNSEPSGIFSGCNTIVSWISISFVVVLLFELGFLFLLASLSILPIVLALNLGLLGFFFNLAFSSFNSWIVLSL